MNNITGNKKLTSSQKVVLTRVKNLVEYWGITAEEIESMETPPGLSLAEMSVIKYRHPQTGQTWTGIGQQPEWLRQALSKEGYRVSELLLSSQQAAAVEPSES